MVVRPAERDERCSDFGEHPGRQALLAAGVPALERAGQPAVSVNDQQRICFRFEDGDAYEVEFCDYH